VSASASGSDRYVTNVSSIKDYYRCRYRWACKWVLNRVPRTEARPLRFGKLLHLVFEDFHLGRGSMDEVIARWQNEWREAQEEVGPSDPAWYAAADSLDDLAQMREPLLTWHDTYEFKVPALEVEQPYELDLGDGIVLRGRPDRIAVDKFDRLWHIQNRGLAAGLNFALYIDLAQRHYHEHLYAEMVWGRYAGQYASYGGTFFNLMRKLKYRTKVTKKNPLGVTKRYDEMFLQHPMSIDLSSALHADVMECIKADAIEMRELAERVRTGNVRVCINEDLNGGAFGNSRDEYFRVLIGEISLNDDRYFKSREDTYSPGGGEHA
jgi:PD-(D/E)XK nuclease superfamily protein